MPRGARIAGWVYFPIHAVVLPLTLGMLLLAVLGELPSDVTCNVLYYLCGLVFTLIAMWRFLRRSFDTMVGSILRCLGMMFAAYGIEVAKLAGVPDTIITKAKTYLRELESGAAQPAAPAHPAQDDAQMTLGDAAGDVIAEQLRAIDLNTITPLEAMRLLFELQQKARG